jgi:hypothetical protein
VTQPGGNNGRRLPRLPERFQHVQWRSGKYVVARSSQDREPRDDGNFCEVLILIPFVRFKLAA